VLPLAEARALVEPWAENGNSARSVLAVRLPRPDLAAGEWR
jgi:hypothetical protein